MVYAPGRSRVRKAEWREVQAVSLPIKQETSAKDFTGRVEVRTSGENANAGRLRAKGSRVGLNPVCKWTRLVGEDSHKLDK
jgi:hypothetical protein